MTTQHDTAQEIARLDAEITACCLNRDMTGAGKALTARKTLEAALKTAAVVGVTVLALACAAVADAKPVKALVKNAPAAFRVNLAKAHAQDPGDIPMPPTNATYHPCHAVSAAAARIAPPATGEVLCTVTWGHPGAFGSGKLVGGFDIVHGKLVWDEGLFAGTGAAV